MSLPEIVHNSQSVVSRFKKRAINRNSTGFTLIEILVVISIIGLLVTSAAFSYSKSLQKGRDSKRKNDLQTLRRAIESYFQTNGSYPVSLPLPGQDWSPYINSIPGDPNPGSSNQYTYSPGTATPPIFTYTLYAVLENTNDTDLGNLPCTGIYAPTAPYNYCVVNP